MSSKYDLCSKFHTYRPFLVYFSLSFIYDCLSIFLEIDWICIPHCSLCVFIYLFIFNSVQFSADGLIKLLCSYDLHKIKNERTEEAKKKYPVTLQILMSKEIPQSFLLNGKLVRLSEALSLEEMQYSPL